MPVPPTPLHLLTSPAPLREQPVMHPAALATHQTMRQSNYVYHTITAGENARKETKIMALVVAGAITISMASVAFAATSISVEQDSTYAGTEGSNSRTFTYSEIFHATQSGSNTTTGGGYDSDGTPGSVSASLEKGYSYYLNSTETAQINVLGSWVAAAEEDNPETTDVDESKAHWVRAKGNNWFDLTPSADGKKYTVSWAASGTDTDTAQAAAQWLKTNYTGVKSGKLTWNSTNKAWEATGLEDGYYLIKSDTGNNLIAATGQTVTIKEKNAYPPLDKTQADEDNETKNDDVRDVAIGDVLSYDVKVTIPKTAAVGDKILVYDNNSVGLTFNNDLQVTNTADATVDTSDYTGEGKVDGAAWQRVITVTDGSQGKDVVFSFTMTVNDSALVDTQKENESGLKYGTGTGTTPWPYESTPDKVEYKTYFAGIHKIDGETNADLAGVEFELKESGVAFNVTKHADGYYYYDKNSTSNKVVTDSEGLIKIRGLDEDKTYTLTETKTLNGYNMLKDDVTLTEQEDTKATYEQATEYAASTTYYNAQGTEVEVADAEAFAAGTFYVKTSGTDSYSAVAATKTATIWGEVKNNKGTVLPSTGGMGTTVLYVVGAVIIIGAGVLLVTRRKMAASK